MVEGKGIKLYYKKIIFKMLRLHCRCRTTALPPNYSYI